MPPKRSSTARKPLGNLLPCIFFWLTFPFLAAKQTSRLAFLHGALTQDIRLLVSEFCKDGNALDFETFKTVWASLDFGLVHLGCREQYDRGPYMDMVFNVIIGTRNARKRDKTSFVTYAQKNCCSSVATGPSVSV